MWFFAALFLVSFFVTAFLGPKIKTENAKAASLDDFDFPRSQEGDSVPRVYGTVKITSPNTIGLANFKTVPIKQKQKTGLFSSKKVVIGFKYYIGVDMAVCLGPNITYRKMWSGENLIWTGCLYGDTCVNTISINLPKLFGGVKDANGGLVGDITLYCGNFDQPRDAWSAGAIDPDVPAYVGTAHMVFKDFYWGNSASIQPISVEIANLTNSLGMPRSFMENGLDVNPIEVLYDLLINDWGNLGFDAASINVVQWRESATTIFNENNGMSLKISNASEGTDICKQILRQINAIIYEDPETGLVDLKLLRNDYVIDDLPVFGPDEIIEVRNYTKKLWSETNNVVRVKYTKRVDDYADGVAVATDSANLRYQGRQRPLEITLPGVYDADLANAIAARELSNVNVPLYSTEVVLNRKGSALRPGDAFKFVWPEYGIVQMIMRVRKLGLGSFEDGRIGASVVQDEFSSNVTVIGPPTNSGYVPTDLSPTDIEVFKIFELPYFLDYNAGLGTRTGYTRLASFVPAPDAYSFGYDAYIEDTPDDVAVLTTNDFANTARLVGSIARFANFSDGIIPVVTIYAVSNPDLLVDRDAGAVRLGSGLIYIGDEILGYETFTNNGDGSYDLENVHRAFLDTGWFAHNADDVVYFFDGAEGFFETDSLPAVSQNVYFIDNTSTGTSDKANAVITPVVPVGRVLAPLAPDYVQGNADRTPGQVFAAGDTLTLSAQPRNRLLAVAAAFETDTGVTAEAGTSYSVAYELGGVTTLIEDEVALPYDVAITEDMIGSVVLHIRAKRDGIYSIASSPFPIIVEPSDGSFTIDYDVVNIDGDGVEF